ncbi:hypothetical protein F5B19DRAFT_138090 [Rostrohypoxylon terebratum]|nr:hypothetical protein F5B19DRAFT_138090 [Rostrohypoxylon terebratum]
MHTLWYPDQEKYTVVDKDSKEAFNAHVDGVLRIQGSGEKPEFLETKRTLRYADSGGAPVKVQESTRFFAVVSNFPAETIEALRQRGENGRMHWIDGGKNELFIIVAEFSPDWADMSNTIPVRDEIPTWTALDKLPYVSAVIAEGERYWFCHHFGI